MFPEFGHIPAKIPAVNLDLVGYGKIRRPRLDKERIRASGTGQSGAPAKLREIDVVFMFRHQAQAAQNFGGHLFIVHRGAP